MEERSTAIGRCRALGVDVTDEQWDALPQTGRERLLSMPHQTSLERRSLYEFAVWLLRTFPPGWTRA